MKMLSISTVFFLIIVSLVVLSFFSVSEKAKASVFLSNQPISTD